MTITGQPDLQTCVILIVHGERYVLQHRDNIPTIADPDMYSLWGGSVEPEDATIEAAAQRELQEGTGFARPVSDFIKLASRVEDARTPKNRGKKVLFHYYAISIDDINAINVREGQGHVVLSYTELSGPKVVPEAHWVADLYREHLASA